MSTTSSSRHSLNPSHSPITVPVGLAPTRVPAEPNQLAAELERLETTEIRERDLRREAELAAARERAKFD